MSSVVVFLIGMGIGIYCGIGIAALMVASQGEEDRRK